MGRLSHCLTGPPGFSSTESGICPVTRYFYFVGLSCRVDPCPLIFDSRVARNFKLLVGRSHSVVAGGEEYVRYVGIMKDWAKQLGCRPDAIELTLWEPPAGFWVESR